LPVEETPPSTLPWGGNSTWPLLAWAEENKMHTASEKPLIAIHNCDM